MDPTNLDIRFRHYSPERVTFQSAKLAKQSRQKKPVRDLFFPKFEQNKKLCPVLTLQEYEKRTTDKRSPNGSRQLLIAMIRPHKSVSSSTVARWLKRVLNPFAYGLRIIPYIYGRPLNASRVIENFEAHPTSVIPARNPPCRRFSFRWCRPYVNVKLSGACSELKITYQLYGLLILNLIRKVRIAEPLYYLASLRILLSLNTVHIIVSFFFKRLPTCITIFDQYTAHVYLRDRFLF